MIQLPCSLPKMIVGGAIYRLGYNDRMKTKPLTFLLALTFLISGSTTVNAKQKFGDYEGAIYVRNYDGDTITFTLPNLHPIIGNKIAIRVSGIDTPEIRGKCDKEKYDAEQARVWLRIFSKMRNV